MNRTATAILLTAALTTTAIAGQRPTGSLADIQTTAERTNFRETSNYEDVVAFLQALAKASNRVHLTTFGATNEKRDLPLAVVGAPAATPQAVRQTGKLRVYLQGNIHAGEVEGKESAQILLRDLAALPEVRAIRRDPSVRLTAR